MHLRWESRSGERGYSFSRGEPRQMKAAAFFAATMLNMIYYTLY
jgi:hypothetical protein